MYTIGFIGAGNMASAIIAGIKSANKEQRMIVHDPHQEKIHALSSQYGVIGMQDNNSILADSDICVLAVKPQILPQLIKELTLRNGHNLLISIAAGVSCDQIHDNGAVIRCMPNTPALVGEGVCGLYANKSCTTEDRQRAEDIFSAVGQVYWFDDEEILHAVTAVTGSGPAYFLWLWEKLVAQFERQELNDIVSHALIDAAVELQIPASVATNMVKQLVKGTIKLADSAPLNYQQLRQQVTSKGGTTEAGIAIMDEWYNNADALTLTNDGIDKMIHQVVRAAWQKSCCLSK